jgi:hypothetical protein
MTFGHEERYRYTPHATPRQLYYGPLYADGEQTVRALEPWIRNLGRLGQLNPLQKARLAMQHGRYLSGFGAAPVAPDGGDALYEAGHLSHLRRLEKDDDSYGSGIFDGPDGAPTANADMGVFSSDYALPGYVGREVPFTVSRDITDITTGGAVVMIPAGGKSAIEQEGALVPYPVLGPTPRPPAMRPPRPTGIDQVYVNVEPPPGRAPYNAGAPIRQVPSMQPSRGLQPVMRPIPSFPADRRIPSFPAERNLPYRSTVNPLGAADTDGPSAGQMAVAGLMVGAAVGMLVGALKK